MKERVARARLSAGGIALATIAGMLASAITARAARADMVVTADGKWYGIPEPKPGDPPLPALGADETPSDEMLVLSENFKVDASYETVKSNTGFSKPAGLVKRVFSHERARNEAFKRALSAMGSNDFKEAAEDFAAAAAASGWGKQEALWGKVQAYAGLQLPAELGSAIDELLAAFPKSLYFAEAQILRAKVAASKDDLAGAAKALAAIGAEKGMNARDQYHAEYVRINLLLETKEKKYDEARTAYQALLDTIAKGDPAQGEVTAQQANVGIGNCLVATKKAKEAAAFFAKASESHDMDVLAGAYAGLGDVALVDARELREAKKLKEAKDKLEEASLHYLRVTLYYKEGVDEMAPVLRSLENQGAVFLALFELTGSQDMELFDRGYNSYFELWKSVGEGTPQKKALNKKLLELKEKKNSIAPKAPGGAAPGPAKPAAAPAPAMADDEDKDKDKDKDKEHK